MHFSRRQISRAGVGFVIAVAFYLALLNPGIDGSVVECKEQHSLNTSLLDRCFRERVRGYWDSYTNSLRFFDPTCDSNMKTYVQEAGKHTNELLFEKMEGVCVLLLGDSTDRQIAESWCPRWMNETGRGGIELWMPRNLTTRELLTSPHEIEKAWGIAGLRCAPQGKFTFGTYLHYGVSPPPYWKFAHTARKDLPSLSWGNSTWDRVTDDVPQFFADCEKQGHHKKLIVVQSYLWDLARQWYIEKTERAPPAMIAEWAQNVTKLVKLVRRTVPDALVGWRFAGPVTTNSGMDAQAIYDMNLAVQAQEDFPIDFVADYGAVLASSLTFKELFSIHPPALPRTAYLNILLNIIIASSDKMESKQSIR